MHACLPAGVGRCSSNSKCKYTSTQSAATPAFSFARKLGLEKMILLHSFACRQAYLSCWYLAHHELESLIIVRKMIKHAYRVRSLQLLTFLGLPFLLTIATCDSHTTDLLGARSCQSLLMRPVSQILCTSKGSASATASRNTKYSHTRPCCKPPVFVSGCATVPAHGRHMLHMRHATCPLASPHTM